jgi:hypothetical protein
MGLVRTASPRQSADMARYELKLFMKNACGPPLLGDVSMLEAPDAQAAMAEASRRVAKLPRNCLGALFDPAGAQIWSDDAPAQAR